MTTRSIAPLIFALLLVSHEALAAPPVEEEEVVIEVEDEPPSDEQPSGAQPTVGGQSEEATAPVEDPPLEPPPAPEQSPAPSTTDPRIEALEARIAALESELSKQNAEPAPSVAKKKPSRFVRFGLERPKTAPTTIGFGPSLGVDEWGVRLSGYLQLQYQWSQFSEDEIQQGGQPLNRHRFMVRRGRVRISGDWQWAAFDFEIDGSTTRGPFMGIRQANASFVWRHKDRSRPPLLMLTAGLTEMPFGYEMRLGQREMPFMERSFGSLSMFPGPIDVGVRLRGAIAAFRYDLAVMGGTPYDDRAGGANAIDPTRKPDGIGRLGFEVTPRKVAIAGGVSGLIGTGFHGGQQAGKSRLEWVDYNENGVLNTGETVAVPGTPATPSYTFERWAVGVDVQLAIQSKAGWSMLAAEATLASNLDRDFLIADPIVYGASLRELSAYGAFMQELYRWALIGARYDYYDPNVDFLDQRRGVLVPVSTAVHTISPIVGALLPGDVLPGFRARLVFQYDMIWDRLGRDEAGVPTNLRNDQFFVRVQGEF